ncbi:cobalamin-independent methionine synthase II family protein [Candidatus Daviesbacteria bacterium]|nr:cobalamin-independent methionine synthase II family protein [Candidatus Daviesbacteria bacterium]MBI4038479.1 cobalamin-independent methionine synthase II family protein [Candidatus Daviesbacteria bacterium]
MTNNGKIKQDKILTAIVGSYPKPKNIYSKSGRELLDTLGFSFGEIEKKIGNKAFKKRLNKACLAAIRDQNIAGIDFITDGEERRSHYVFHILKGLNGLDFKNLKSVPYRGGIFQRDVPVVSDSIKYKKPILINEFKFTKKHAETTPKIGLPGPSTVVDCVADEFYRGDLEKMAFDYAQAIHHEVESLIEEGCRVIQFDDPVLLRFPDRAKKWGLKALEKCFNGLESKATYIVHICCGYPNKPLEAKGIRYKANADYYHDVLSWLADSKIDIVSIEGAQSKLDLSVLPSIGKKTVMLGVLDVGKEKVESVDWLTRRGKEALKYLPPKQLILGPDCGMLELSRESAKQKLKNLALATKVLNGEVI